MKQLIATFDNVIIKPIKYENKTASGLIVSTDDKLKIPVVGEVVSVGPDCKLIEKGMIVELPNGKMNRAHWLDEDTHEYIEWVVVKETDIQAIMGDVE